MNHLKNLLEDVRGELGLIESEPQVDPDIEFALAVIKALKKFGKFSMETSSHGYITVSKNPVGRPRRCKEALFEWLKKHGYRQGKMKPGGWTHRDSWMFTKGSSQVKVSHEGIYDAILVDIYPGASLAGAPKRKPGKPGQQSMF